MSELPLPESVEPLDPYERFFEAALSWEMQLNDPVPEEQDLEVLANEICEELDPICPYYGEMVAITGRGLIPVVDEETWEVEEIFYSDDIQGIHQGVKILPYQGPEDLVERPRVMHLITVGRSGGMISQTEYRQSTYLAYFLIEPSTIITPIDEIEEIYGDHFNGDHQPLDTRLDKTEAYVKRARDLVCSTGFRRQHHRRQSKMLSALVDEAERETALRELYVNVEAPLGYLTQNGRDHTFLFPFDLSEIPVSGCVLGLESLENLRLRKGKAIRRDADLVFKNAGLCLIISPDEETQDILQLQPTQTIFLPLGGQVVKMAFSGND